MQTTRNWNLRFCKYEVTHTPGRVVITDDLR
jgi:hypothetical protein